MKIKNWWSDQCRRTTLSFRNSRKSIRPYVGMLLQHLDLIRSAVCANAIVRCVEVCGNLGRPVQASDIILCLMAITVDMVILNLAVRLLEMI